MSGVKRQAQSEWYSPYFAPTTVIIAITVLGVSILAGRYVGGLFVQRDRATTAAATTATYTSSTHRMTTKTAAHHSRTKTIHAAPSKN